MDRIAKHEGKAVKRRDAAESPAPGNYRRKRTPEAGSLQDLPLAELTVAQKLDLMERLRTDLSANEAAIKSPAWHATVIEERLKAVEEGQAAYGDWDEAKERLHQRLP